MFQQRWKSLPDSTLFSDFDLYRQDKFMAIGFTICVINLLSICIQQRPIHACVSGSPVTEVKTSHSDFPHSTWKAVTANTLR